jgi:hypothetical protein
MKLEPESFTCPDHALDLTDAVKAKLSEVAVMSFGVSFGRLFSGRSPLVRKFCVVMKCPGGGQGHQVVFRRRVDESNNPKGLTAAERRWQRAADHTIT